MKRARCDSGLLALGVSSWSECVQLARSDSVAVLHRAVHHREQDLRLSNLMGIGLEEGKTTATSVHPLSLEHCPAVDHRPENLSLDDVVFRYFEEVSVQHDEVGPLSCLQGAAVILSANHVGRL